MQQFGVQSEGALRSLWVTSACALHVQRSTWCYTDPPTCGTVLLFHYLLTVEAHFSPSRWPEMEEIQVWFLRHFEQSQKITIVLERSLSEASWQQRAGESLKRTVFTLKQWFFWGGGSRGAEDNLKGGHIATNCRKTDLLEKTLTSLTFRQQNVYSQMCSS